MCGSSSSSSSEPDPRRESEIRIEGVILNYLLCNNKSVGCFSLKIIIFKIKLLIFLESLEKPKSSIIELY